MTAPPAKPLGAAEVAADGAPQVPVPVLADKRARSWPKHASGAVARYLPLSAAMTLEFKTDAHFAAYSVPRVKRRIAKEVLTLPADLAVVVEMGLAVFDVDDSSHKAKGGAGTPLVGDDWWLAELEKITRLRAGVPGVFVYRTRGGYRLIARLPHPFRLAAPPDAESWKHTYLAWVSHLKRVYGIEADASCSDFTRLFRTPHATRDGYRAPERRETIGDPHAIGIWSCALEAVDYAAADKAAKSRNQRGGRGPRSEDWPEGVRRADAEGVLVHLFRARGWLGAQIEPGKWIVECPNESAHSRGGRFDSSTVIFAPARGEIFGWLHCSHAHCQGRTLRDVLSAFSPAEIEAAKTAAGVKDEHPESPAVDRRPRILLVPELARVADEVEAALLAGGGFETYQKGGALVRVCHVGPDAPADRSGVKRVEGTPFVSLLPPAGLRERMSRAATYWRPAPDGEQPRQTDPPPPIVDALLARDRWNFPVLEGVVDTPVLRPDGSLLDVAGYDAASHLLYVPAKEFPSLNERPTKEMALAACGQILDVLHDFPFANQASRAAAVAALLSMVGRPAIDGPVPLFAIDAPTPGTGKTLLANVLARIAFGRDLAVTTVAQNEEEWRKRIHALAIEGASGVLIDNVEIGLGSAALAGALTGGAIKERMLGVTQMVEARNRAVWLATGNNLSFTGDLGRRVLLVQLEPDSEFPEDRCGFKYPELLRHVASHREVLVVAALTILRAFIVAARPGHGRARMGSFEAWDDLVRAAVVWLGLGDPCDTRGRVRAEQDETRAALAAVMAALVEEFGSKAFTVAEVVRASGHAAGLRQALDEAIEPGGDASPRPHAIGIYLRHAKRRISNGRRIVRCESSTGGSARWRVESVRGDRGDRGNA